MITLGGVDAYGGTITVANGRKYHTFTDSGYFEIVSNPSNLLFEIFLVGGGGSGGNDLDGSGTGGGGGGGGRVVLLTDAGLTGYFYCQVGGGGGFQSDGNDTAFGNDIFALGGGRGANGGGYPEGFNGSSGGSGGGGGGGWSDGGGGGGTEPALVFNLFGGTLSQDQGNTGGPAGDNLGGGGGGGGAGGSGLLGGPSGTGTGGSGYAYNGVYYGAGGGGANGATLNGGAPGGVNYGETGFGYAQPGGVNTGNGGGGGGNAWAVGGAGGSGIVIISYPDDPISTASLNPGVTATTMWINGIQTSLTPPFPIQSAFVSGSAPSSWTLNATCYTSNTAPSGTITFYYAYN